MKARRVAVPMLAAAGLAVTATGAMGARGDDTLRASLSGAKNVGSRGAGTGTFSGHFASGGRFCFTLVTHGVSNVILAHIHKGGPRTNGGIVISLNVNHAGRTQKCVRPPANEIRNRAAILAHPGRFYVNVHTKRFPNGTMRGQLHA